MTKPHSNDRTVPNFLGVGPPKCATTWLDQQLRGHSQVFLPLYQKETFFFSRYYDRGPEWYAQIFKDSNKFRAVGEICTNYILKNEFLERIYKFNSNVKIIIILREPLARLLSHYKMMVENEQSMDSFQATLHANWHLVEYSCYKKRLEDLKNNFKREQIFAGIFEEIFSDKSTERVALKNIANFLDIDPALLPIDLPGGVVRQTMGAPRHPKLTRFAKRVRRKLKDSDLEWMIHTLDRFGVNRSLFVKPTSRTSNHLNEELEELDELFAPDRAAVEAFLERPVNAWRKGGVGRR